MSEDLIYVHEDSSNPDIKGKISQGGWSDVIRLIDCPSDVSLLVLGCSDFRLSNVKDLYEKNGYSFPEKLPFKVIHADLDDYVDIPSDERIEIMRKAWNAALQVVEAVKAGKHVVVTCWAGLNRSGLVTALALTKLGFSPSDAIDIVRKGRSRNALCNDDFVDMILCSEGDEV